MNFNRHSSRMTNGSLLIESLLVVMIVSVSLTLIIQALVMSLRAIIQTADYSVVMFKVEDKMNQIIRKGLFDQSFDDVIKNDRKEKFKYTLQENTLEGEEGDLKLKEISLDIAWQAGKKENQLSLVTYLLPFSVTSENKE